MDTTDDARRRSRPAGACLALVALVVVTAAATTACSTSSTVDARASAPSPSQSPLVTGGPTLAPAVWPSADKKHRDIVFSYLGATTPQEPVVYLLGGSAARECTVSDTSWRRDIGRDGADVLAFNLGTTNQSFDEDIGMVRAMPKAPSLVIIGINLGRYTSAPGRPYRPPAPGPALTLAQVDEYDQHKFDEHHILRDERKIAIITDYWLGERQAYFDENFAYNAARLGDLVAACKKRGFGVVLLNLPLNLQTVDHRLDEQRRQYEQNCLAVAHRYDVPYVDFVSDIPFVSRDFADNWHLVPTGRVKWQRELSRVAATELARQGIGSSPAATTAP